jgi:hypothetical protein
MEILAPAMCRVFLSSAVHDILLKFAAANRLRYPRRFADSPAVRGIHQHAKLHCVQHIER